MLIESGRLLLYMVFAIDIEVKEYSSQYEFGYNKTVSNPTMEVMILMVCILVNKTKSSKHDMNHYDKHE